MEKSFLEKRIEEKAKKRFDNLYDRAMKVMQENEILLELKIESMRLVSENHYTGNIDLFSKYKNKLLSEKTNFEEIKKKLIKKYIAEETDNLMKRLEDINCFFENNI